MFQPSFETRFTEALDGLTIGPHERTLIINRYVRLVEATKARARVITILFMALTNIITIGGVIIVAFLTLEKISLGNEAAAAAFFWTSLVLSLAVTVANKSLYGFDIAKQYIFMGALIAKYESEGWSFIAGIGRYGPTPADKVPAFMDRIEKIYLKSAEIAANVAVPPRDPSADGKSVTPLPNEILIAAPVPDPVVRTV